MCCGSFVKFAKVKILNPLFPHWLSFHHIHFRVKVSPQGSYTHFEIQGEVKLEINLFCPKGDIYVICIHNHIGGSDCQLFPTKEGLLGIPLPPTLQTHTKPGYGGAGPEAVSPYIWIVWWKVLLTVPHLCLHYVLCALLLLFLLPGFAFPLPPMKLLHKIWSNTKAFPSM